MSDEKKKKNKIIDILIFIISVFVSFCIWFYASSEEEIILSRTFTDIPIEIKTNSSYLLMDKYDYALDVTVAGKRNIVNSITADDFSASVDCTDASTAGKYTYEVKLSTPKEVDIEEQSVSSVIVELDRLSTVNVPVKVEVTNYSVSEPYEIGNVTCNTEQISVSGPNELVKKISCALCRINGGQMTNNASFGGTLIAVDKNGEEVKGDIHLSQNTATVQVTMYCRKTYPLKTKFKHGFYNVNNASVKVNPQTVTVKGEKSVIEGITDIYVATIDEKQVFSDSISREIEFPEGVINESGITSADVSITFSNTKDFTVSVNSKNFEVINPNDIKYRFVTKSLDVNLRGPESFANFIKEENVKVTVDLSSLEKGDGEVTLDAVIGVSGYTGGYYELGTYTVTVNV